MAMNKVRITVLKTTLDEELAEEYGVPGLQACPMMRAGQEFYADYAKPEGFCDASRCTTTTGCANLDAPSSAATTACAPSS